MSRHRTPEKTLKSTLKNNVGSIIASVLLLVVVVGILGIRAFQSASNTGAASADPTKPTGTQVGGTQMTGNWTVAKGLPGNVTRMTFSSQKPTQGYASAFMNGQTQDIYETTDGGSNWQKISSVQAPVGDIISSESDQSTGYSPSLYQRASSRKLFNPSNL